MKKYLLLLLICSSAFAVVTLFSYTSATQWADGTPIEPGDIRSTRLYCNGEKVQGHQGATGSFDPDLPDGTYQCYAIHTVVNNSGLKCKTPDAAQGDAVCLSDHSNTVTRVIGSPEFAPATKPPILE